MTSLLTIIVPTKNRSSFVERMLKYYEASKIKINFLILDSSDEIERKKIKKIIDFYKKIFNINFFSAKLYPVPIISKYVCHVLTKYSLISSDDDFYSLEELQFGIFFLEKNSNYSLYNGPSIIINDLGYVRLINKYPIRIFAKNLDLNKKLISHIDNYTPLNTSIIRTDNLIELFKLYDYKNIHKFCPMRNISDEMLISFLFICSGNIKTSNEIFLIRVTNHDKYILPKKYNQNQINLSVDYLISILSKFLTLRKLSNMIIQETLINLRENLIAYFQKSASRKKINFYKILKKKFNKKTLFFLFKIRHLFNKDRDSLYLKKNPINKELLERVFEFMPVKKLKE